MITVKVSGSLEKSAQECVDKIKSQMESRAYRGANELRNASLLVLRGQGGGRRYRVPGTKRYYTASAPGSPPAVRTGAFRLSWQPSAHVMFGSYISRVESERRTDNGRYVLGELLENGTSKMAPRPHHERIQEKALPEIMRIYEEPYF